MGLGIKEPARTNGEHVPGTAVLYDALGDGAGHDVLPGDVKHARNSNLILVPQPSESPNDPLVSTVDGNEF